MISEINESLVNIKTKLAFSHILNTYTYIIVLNRLYQLLFGLLQVKIFSHTIPVS